MKLTFRRHLLSTACLLAAMQLAFAQQPLVSGIDLTTGDPKIRIQDDAFRAVEGRWLADTAIPPDRNSIGGFERLFDETQLQLRGLVDDASANGATDPGAKQIGDLYASFMDEARVESLGLAPVAAELARIDALRTRADIAALIGEFDRIGVNVPFGLAVHQDAKDSSQYVADLGQAGIGLPDRDYFLSKTDQRFATIRAQYAAYIAKMLTMVGEKDGAAKAKAVVALETGIARAQWTQVENRDPVKGYNPTPVRELAKLAPHVDWTRYLDAVGIAGRTDTVVISQPTYLKRLDRLVADVPLSTWKAYFKTALMTAYAGDLGRDFVDTRFAFVGTVLRGTPENSERWKRGVRIVEGALGEGLGQLYVAKYFPPESKARMDTLVQNLLAAYGGSIDGLDWMTAATKAEAKAKLATFMPKIGYPVRWRDYSGLAIDRADLVGNAMRAARFEHQHALDKLGRPIDRDEWGMTPQTINAYYNPELNEVVFPAAMLQAPFFDPKADDAANYGAIGAVIGHEISHGFDDQGSQYDGKGNLRDWWTPEDRRRFAEKTQALVAQYDAYSPIPGYQVNGALTLGENIADNSGLAIAFKAYRLSLGGKTAAVIDGLTGDQRFFMGFVQAWQEKNREASIVAQLKSDPHAPGEFRANGTLRNQPGFYEAFGVKPGDRMYLAPDRRVIIW